MGEPEARGGGRSRSEGLTALRAQGGPEPERRGEGAPSTGRARPT